MEVASFRKEIRSTRKPEDRVAWFGAMLAKETGRAVEVVGGSAIEIYLTSASYVSQDIDLVGNRDAIESVLLRWGFHQVKGRSQRTYWTDNTVGLVDLVGLADRSGLPPRHVDTPYGPVLLSAPEPLIIRRLMRSKREETKDLFDQAVALAHLGGLDWDYLQSEAHHERVEDELARLRTILERRGRVRRTRAKSGRG